MVSYLVATLTNVSWLVTFEVKGTLCALILLAITITELSHKRMLVLQEPRKLCEEL